MSKKYVLPGLNFCVLACLFVSCVFACLFVSVCPNVSTLSSCDTQCVPLKMNRLPPPVPLRVHLTPLPCPRAPSGALCIMLYFHTLYLRHFLENKSSPISPLRKKSYIPCNFRLCSFYFSLTCHREKSTILSVTDVLSIC